MNANLFLEEFIQDRNIEKYLPDVLNNKVLCAELFQLIEQQAAYPKAEYASWFWMHIARERSEFTQQYYSKLVDLLFQTDKQTILRNILNAIIQLKLTNYREGEFIELLFSFLHNKKNKVALHVYSIYTLLKFCRLYPELHEELKLSVSFLMEQASPALRIAVRKISEFN
jgi:hypothetical protein